MEPTDTWSQGVINDCAAEMAFTPETMDHRDSVIDDRRDRLQRALIADLCTSGFYAWKHFVAPCGVHQNRARRVDEVVDIYGQASVVQPHGRTDSGVAA
ncbi:hypothetical protein [Micromonospora sp. S-DT3-3-22]|uniref:hypothetical protein n=1 Tax=Micromonospora sp. S-DT3-3-22 TaxID=2755359 RepID=UPI00188EB178|nr:hypothetical protein [Micromonospora sp. S-DT3-3-22]